MGAATSAPSASDQYTFEEQADHLSKLFQASALQNAQLQSQLENSAAELESCQQTNAHLLAQLRDLNVHYQSQSADICKQNDQLRSKISELEARLLTARIDPVPADAPLLNCSAGIINGKNRRDERFLRDVFNRHKDSSGGLHGRHLAQALNDAHAIICPRSDQDVSDLIQQFDLSCSGSLNFAGFQQAVNAPDDLQLWFEEKQLPIAADALRPLIGQGGDQLRELSQLSAANIAHSAAALCSFLPQMLNDLLKEIGSAFAVQTSMEAERKADPSKFNDFYKMACGNIADFHQGLTGRVGMPHLNFKNAMRQEHCERCGCNVEFTTSNYNITTTPQREWQYIVENFACADMGYQRRLAPIKELMQKKVCRDAKLCEEEVVAVVLYSGPMFQVYNTILRRYPSHAFAVFKDGDNLFPTTIFVLVSAIQKLCRFTRIPEGTMLYRGLGGKVDLPDLFFQTDEHGCSGYAEWGFLSTTADRDVALGYSGINERRHKAMVMVIETSSIDRGADISEFSQYPSEKEFLYLPCSFVQRTLRGRGRLQVVDGALVTFVSVKVNLNIKTQTVEELQEQKKSLHLVSARSLLSEVKYDLTDWIESSALQGIDLSRCCGNVAEYSARVVSKVEKVIQAHESYGAVDFANDELFRLMINEILDAKAAAIEARKWQQMRIKLFDHDMAVAASGPALQGHSRDVLCVAFHPSKPVLATSSGDGSARLWRLSFDGSTASCSAILQGHTGNVCFVAFHPSLSVVATGSSDHTAKLWLLDAEASEATCVATLQGHSNTIWSVAFHPIAPFFATASDDKSAKWWLLNSDATAATCLATLLEHTKLVSSVAFHPTADVLATGSDDMTAKLWRLNAERTAVACVATLQQHDNWVSYVVFHPTAHLLATCSYDCTAKLWQLNSDCTAASCVGTLRGHSNCVVTASFHPLLPILATGSSDGSAKLWQLTADPEGVAGTCAATLQGHSQGVWSVAFHPSAPLLATGSADNTAKVWH